MEKRLIWFRDDLRITDNSALKAALDGIQPNQLDGIFLTAEEEWKTFGYGQNRLFYTEQLLRSLASSLAACGINFQVVRLNHYSDQVNWIVKYCRECRHDSLFFNHEYQLNEVRRDQSVVRELEPQVSVYGFTDRILLKPGDVLTAEQKYYSVFSPFKRRWLEVVKRHSYRVFEEPAITNHQTTRADWVPLAISSSSDLSWAATTEEDAKRRLGLFVDERLSQYDTHRNKPSLSGTSQISPYLARGLLSPRQCIDVVETITSRPIWDLPEVKFAWVNELIWREFYQHLLIGFPRLSMNQAFRPKTENVLWINDIQSIEDWKNGTTGIPIVDAGMRELRATGWMHNRTRMIVAQFLTKNLLCDWRIGESHFMSWLIDSDLGANNGGWQWSASTGTDSAPYFRVFNPVSQATVHDAEGLYVKRWIPELASLPPKKRQAPWTGVKPVNYPLPIVDLKKSRQRAIDAFKDLK